jgi:hypothetical protein
MHHPFWERAAQRTLLIHRQIISMINIEWDHQIGERFLHQFIFFKCWRIYKVL